MLHRYNAVGPEEDWSGLRDAKKRRKLQNRLNQRAHRQRKAGLDSTSGPLSATNADRRHLHFEPGREFEHHPVVQSYRRNEDYEIVTARASSESSDEDSAAIVVVKPEVLALCGWSQYEQQMPGFYFPLTVDHLLTLIHYNVFRALNANCVLLQLEEHVQASEVDEYAPLLSKQYDQVPPALAPTALQRTQPHVIWIDIFPHPGIRENGILRGHEYDMDDFCCDLVGHCYQEGYETSFRTNGNSQRNGLFVWGEPWDWRNWEISEGFLRKWGWLLKGCDDMLAATNKWRATRGEAPLIEEL